MYLVNLVSLPDIFQGRQAQDLPRAARLLATLHILLNRPVGNVVDPLCEMEGCVKAFMTTPK